MPPQAKPLSERFHDKYIPEPNSGCWIWTAAVIFNGISEYGVIGDIYGGRKMVLAHRASYELHTGKIKARHHIDHLCENTYCVNPDHLEMVNHVEHGLRTHARKYGADHCQKGHPFSKENTWIEKNGQRHCRECHKLKQRGYMERLRAKRKN